MRTAHLARLAAQYVCVLHVAHTCCALHVARVVSAALQRHMPCGRWADGPSEYRAIVREWGMGPNARSLEWRFGDGSGDDDVQ